MWRIYYSDGSSVQGESPAAWAAAPDTGVQVVVRFPRQGLVRWHYDGDNGEPCVVRDRDLWTGDDTYDPFGWGVKYGELIDKSTYIGIWGMACADD